MADQDKTEKPTARRRYEVRKKGATPRSIEVPSAIGLLVIAALIPMTAVRLWDSFAAAWVNALQISTRPTLRDAEGLVRESSMEAARALTPLFLAVAGASVVGQLATIGGRPNIYALKPRFEALNPIQGVKRIFSKTAAFELFKTAAKILAVAVVSYTIWQSAFTAMTSSAMSITDFLRAVGGSLRDLLFRMTALAIVIAAVDAVVSRRRFNKQLKMSVSEVRDEFRQAEGDPAVKGEMRKRMAKMSRSRMMAEVATADVVLVNPTHIAVALRYDEMQPAPVVVAKGAGFVAQRIREEATRHGVPIMENKPLARALHRSVEVGSPIPVELYRAVAEVLAVIYRTRRGPKARTA